jgi:hypothetical protein
MDKHVGILALLVALVAAIYLHASGKLVFGAAGHADKAPSGPPSPLSGAVSSAEIMRMAEESNASMLEPFAWRDAWGRSYVVNPQIGHIALTGG